MNKPKMMPGQTPYTDEEWEKLQGLGKDALEAEEVFSLDELEEFVQVFWTPPKGSTLR